MLAQKDGTERDSHASTTRTTSSCLCLNRTLFLAHGAKAVSPWQDDGPTIKHPREMLSQRESAPSFRTVRDTSPRTYIHIMNTKPPLLSMLVRLRAAPHHRLQSSVQPQVGHWLPDEHIRVFRRDHSHIMKTLKGLHLCDGQTFCFEYSTSTHALKES